MLARLSIFEVYFFLYHSTQTATQLKRIKFMILKTRQTISLETKPEGAIKARQIQTPKAQDKLMSFEDFLFITFRISGIFHKGITTAATKPIS
jgi:hypothetical protein